MSVNKKKYNRILKFLSVIIVIILTYFQNLSPFEALLHLFVDFEFQTINNPIINELYKGGYYSDYPAPDDPLAYISLTYKMGYTLGGYTLGGYTLGDIR